ncbi:MAG: nitrilase-related carbon-nitrogen hydrolase [Candidatus Methanofastidiosia archaeon]|jgi:N-carbamoylputrescine amidase
MRIACIQVGAEPHRDKTFAKVEDLIQTASEKRADIACLPELTIDQFFPQWVGEEKFFALAEPLNGPIVQKFQKIAKQYSIALIPNVYEKGGPDTYYDTSPVIDAHGKLLGSQHMIHIAEDPTEDEKFYYTPGQKYNTFSVAGITIGIAICYDRHFPEHMRILTLKGAQIIFVPTATTGLHRKAWYTEAQASAIVNNVFVAHANKVGTEGALTFFGKSIIVNPTGEIIAEASEDKEEVVVADIDVSLIKEMRKEWPFLRDRRPEMYGDLI